MDNKGKDLKFILIHFVLNMKNVVIEWTNIRHKQ